MLTACLIASGCCGPKLEDVVKEHKPKIEQQIATIKPIQEQVLRLPKLEQDTWQHKGDPIVLDLRASPDPANASLCHAEDLANPEELGYVLERITWSGLLNRCASVVRRGHEVFDPAYPTSYLIVPSGITAQELFKRCEAVRYLVVLRTIDFVDPSFPSAADAGVIPELTCSSPAGAASSSPASSSTTPPAESRRVFQGGLVRAEVHVFDTNGARYEGGFRIQAQSSPKLKGDDVHADFKARLVEAVAAGVRRQAPGATVRM